MASGRLDELLASRNSWPKWLNSAVDYVATHPMSLAGKLAALRYRPKGPLPDISAVTPAEVRLAIGPVNYSNQATLWASALRELCSDISTSTFALEVPGGFDFPSDVIIPQAFYHKSKKWQLAQAEALTSFTHILVEAEEPLLGRLFGRSLREEQRYFVNAGVNLAYMAHGTDIRVPSVHAERTVWSPYRDTSTYSQKLNLLAKSNLNFLNSISEPVFVSTPDLLLDLPQAVWIPVVVELATWNQFVVDVPENRPLRVAHIPSVQSIKGTHLIEPVLRQLQEQGVIEYTPIQGVSSQDMPKIIAQADVVLDQFRLGSYGVAACEAMAAGKTVIGHVLPEVREIVKRQTGLQLPIVEATPDDLCEVISDLATRPGEFKVRAEVGITFIEEVHSGELSASRLLNNWIRNSSLNISEVGKQ